MMPAKMKHYGPSRRVLPSVCSLAAIGLALGLSGCSSAPSGPSKHDVLKGLAQYTAAMNGDYKGDYTKAKKFYFHDVGPSLRLQKCAKTGVESWTCDFYYIDTKGKPYNAESIKMRHVAGKWDYVTGSYRNIGADISRN